VSTRRRRREKEREKEWEKRPTEASEEGRSARQSRQSTEKKLPKRLTFSALKVRLLEMKPPLADILPSPLFSLRYHCWSLIRAGHGRETAVGQANQPASAKEGGEAAGGGGGGGGSRNGALNHKPTLFFLSSAARMWNDSPSWSWPPLLLSPFIRGNAFECAFFAPARPVLRRSARRSSRRYLSPARGGSGGN